MKDSINAVIRLVHRGREESCYKTASNVRRLLTLRAGNAYRHFIEAENLFSIKVVPQMFTSVLVLKNKGQAFLYALK